jgi:UDP-N-acetylmuramate--alanine ligase
LIGIGGTGMSAIARVLRGQGYRVTGSDRNPGDLASALVLEGASVIIGHDAANVVGADAVIVTSAAAADHVEVAAARAAGIPVYKRSDIIADIIGEKIRCIAVAGTHGKTTTTAMITHMKLKRGETPGYIIGGTLPLTGKNGEAAGDRGYSFVIEADEYDYMFLGLRPDVAVVTNIEWDHPDLFKTPEAFYDAFVQFTGKIRRGFLSALVVCADDEGAMQLGEMYKAQGGRVITYGIDNPDANFRAYNLVSDADGSHFTLNDYDGQPIDYHLPVPGRHNVLNALAAVAAIAVEVYDTIFENLSHLEGFIGVGRRFQIDGERDGVVVANDYAHHPTAIRATLEAARSRYPDRAIWAVWQPHTFSRTQALWDDFALSFVNADHVLVTPIYAAREDPIPGVDGEAMARAITLRGHKDTRFVESFAEAVELLNREVTAPAVIMILSAGDAPQIGRAFLGR